MIDNITVINTVDRENNPKKTFVIHFDRPINKPGPENYSIRDHIEESIYDLFATGIKEYDEVVTVWSNDSTIEVSIQTAL